MIWFGLAYPHAHARPTRQHIRHAIRQHPSILRFVCAIYRHCGSTVSSPCIFIAEAGWVLVPLDTRRMVASLFVPHQFRC